MKIKTAVKRAIKEAEKSPHRVRVGVVVLKNGKFVGATHNTLKTHPMLENFPPFRKTLHAEMRAIAKFRDFDTIVIARIHKNGRVVTAIPCESCMELLKEMRDGCKIIYTIEKTENNLHYGVIEL